MRTTLHIDDDVHSVVKSIAEAEGKSIGKVMSALARKALAPRTYAQAEDGLPIFVVSDGVAPLTMDMVKKAGEED